MYGQEKDRGKRAIFLTKQNEDKTVAWTPGQVPWALHRDASIDAGPGLLRKPKGHRSRAPSVTQPDTGVPQPGPSLLSASGPGAKRVRISAASRQQPTSQKPWVGRGGAGGVGVVKEIPGLNLSAIP